MPASYSHEKDKWSKKHFANWEVPGNDTVIMTPRGRRRPTRWAWEAGTEAGVSSGAGGLDSGGSSGLLLGAALALPGLGPRQVTAQSLWSISQKWAAHPAPCCQRATLSKHPGPRALSPLPKAHGHPGVRHGTELAALKQLLQARRGLANFTCWFLDQLR